MSVVRSPVRSVVRSPVRSVLGSGALSSSNLQQLLALSPSLLIWPEKGSGWQGTSGGTLSATGQPVGLLPDLAALEGKTQAAWLANAPELVTNGGFDSDTIGWTDTTNATFTVSGGKGTLTSSSNGVFHVDAEITATVGRLYIVEVDLDPYTVTGGLFVSIRNAAKDIVLPVLLNGVTTSGSQTFMFVATATTHYLRFGGGSSSTAGQNVTIDNISIKELPGNHLRAGTWASPADSSRALYGRVPLGGRRNMLTRTEEFDNAAWAKVRVVATADSVAAPDGTTTAELLVEDTTPASSHEVGRSIGKAASEIAYSASVYVRPAGRDWVCLTLFDNSATGTRAWFNVTTGALGTTAAIGAGFTSVSHSIEALAAGWYRCVLTATSSTTTAIRPILYTSTADGSFSHTGDGASGLYLWGAQLEAASTATAYQKVTTAQDVTEAGVADTYYTTFDGVNDYFSLLNAISITEDMTVVRAFKRSVAGINSVGLGAAAADAPHEARWATNNNYAVAWPASRVNGPSTDTGSFVLTSRRNASVTNVRRSGVEVVTGAPGAVTGSFDNLGRRNTLYNFGEISFLAVFPSELTGADLDLVERIAAGTNGSVLA